MYLTQKIFEIRLPANENLTDFIILKSKITRKKQNLF